MKTTVDLTTEQITSIGAANRLTLGRYCYCKSAIAQAAVTNNLLPLARRLAEIGVELSSREAGCARNKSRRLVAYGIPLAGDCNIYTRDSQVSGCWQCSPRSEVLEVVAEVERLAALDPTMPVELKNPLGHWSGSWAPLAENLIA